MTRMNFSYLVIIVLLILSLSSCNEKRVFNDYNEAKKYFLEEEQLTNKDIVEEYNIDNQYLILFEYYDGEENVYAITNFIELEDGRLKWDSMSSKLSIDGTENGRPVGTEYKTKDDKTVSFSIGIYDELSFAKLSENIKKGIINIDEDREIYYIVDL